FPEGAVPQHLSGGDKPVTPLMIRRSLSEATQLPHNIGRWVSAYLGGGFYRLDLAFLFAKRPDTFPFIFFLSGAGFTLFFCCLFLVNGFVLFTCFVFLFLNGRFVFGSFCFFVFLDRLCLLIFFCFDFFLFGAFFSLGFFFFFF